MSYATQAITKVLLKFQQNNCCINDSFKNDIYQLLLDKNIISISPEMFDQIFANLINDVTFMNECTKKHPNVFKIKQMLVENYIKSFSNIINDYD